MLDEQSAKQRKFIKESIEALQEIKRYYRGVRQQKAAFDALVTDLRKAYRTFPELFTKMDIMVLKHVIQQVGSYTGKLEYSDDNLNELDILHLPLGAIVFHR
ncbi:hypothetical protein MFMK1_001302 [Metallumcola ferriviriculae]|uniref:Uncharacterized protein n=1 Tax=Metallumcola ferriviriculae TaxID=3039180 RepID=A0AAU0ULU2_9FIRM|nr:hypothetical protein MFMK1_001302 [Desulfitibacteraceae bacterium MK1]